MLHRHGMLRQQGQQQRDRGGDSAGAGVEEQPWHKLGRREAIMALAVAETTLAHAAGSGDDAPGSGSGAGSVVKMFLVSYSWTSVCGLLVGP